MSLELLNKLGVYTQESFLPPELCLKLCAEIEGATLTDAKVYKNNAKVSEMDNKMRQSLFGEVSKQSDSIIRKKIVDLRTELEAHFSDKYDQQFEGPRYLVYNQGHFFGPHTDDQLGRKINITIYLNDEVDDAVEVDNSYSGGSLKIYGLSGNPAMKDWGVSVKGKQGLLVAYKADLPHEITPILSGRRFAIVSRFLEPRQ